MHFEFATATRIIFGEGEAATLPELARGFGLHPLVVTGASNERAAALVSAPLGRDSCSGATDG